MNPYPPFMSQWPDLSKAAVGDLIIYCPICPEQWIVGKDGDLGITTCKRDNRGMYMWKVEPGEREKQAAFKAGMIGAAS